MKIKTLVIAPYQGLAEITGNLQHELSDFEITVIQGDMKEVLPYIRRNEAKKFDVLISRGGTARLLREHTDVPVVDIQVSGYDIMRILTLVQGYKLPVEMIGFPNVIDSVAAVSSVMKVNVPFRTVHSEEEVEQEIQRAKRLGIMVIIGDTVTVRKAREAGLQGVLVTSGRESILEAFARAKEIYNSGLYYKTNYELYKRIVDRIDHGIALYDPDGLREANPAFYRLLRASEDALGLTKEQERIAFFEKLVRTLHNAGCASSIAVSLDEGQTLMVSCDSISQQEEEQLFCVVVRPVPDDACELRISYTNEFVESFPQLITANPEFAELLREVEDYYRSGNCISLYGENGSGKRLLVGAANQDGRFAIEVEMNRVTEEATAMLTEWIEHAEQDVTFFIKNTEKLHIQAQRALVRAASSTKARLVFGFETDPELLLDKGKLNAKLYKMVSDKLVFIQTLRDDADKVEEYIRTFIVKYNEQFGKQIVGVRGEVMEKLLAYPWPGNIIEMRDTIREFVRMTDGEYIGADVLALLGKSSGEAAARPAGETLNLNQPLEDIEREIILKVLEEEGGSQTKAAQRLGINRTTLWRKLNRP